MWRFSKARSDIFCFPGLWDVAHTTDGRIESFTIVRTAPGPDCAPYHNRQPVVLEPDQWATWLDLTADPAPCLRAGLEGVIAVERAVETAADAQTYIAAHEPPDATVTLRRSVWLSPRLPVLSSTCLAILVVSPVGAAQPAPDRGASPCPDSPLDSAQACSDRPLNRIYGRPQLGALSTGVNLPEGAVGMAYDVALIRGGVAPYVGHIIGSLPIGLHVDAAGHLFGVPDHAGSFPFVFVVRDSSAPPMEVTEPFELVVRDKPAPGTIKPPSP